MTSAISATSKFALTSIPPGAREKRVAFIVVSTAIATLALMAPFARTPLPRIDAYIPAYESALAISDLITGMLLVSQFLRLRQAAILVLACGYLFGALIIPHALSFPGVFSTTGLLGAKPQTTAWLYCFWHGGFAVFVLAYALLAGRSLAPIPRPASAASVAVAATTVLAVAITLLTTLGHDLLPIVIDGRDYSMLVTKGISPAICAVSLVALIFLWRRRQRSTLDLWMFVVMCAWLRLS
jgi:two-component system sensor histidine kinase UhpB